MKATRFLIPGIRRMELASFETGSVPDDGILIENQYTAVSVGTEIHGWTHGGEPGNPVRFPRATGYCNVGTVLEVGKDVEGIRPGDRVAGQGNHASHCVLSGPRSFHQRVPDSVSSEAAAFMVMGAIAIHGIRVARIELGEVVVVIGLGIVGQLASTLAGLSGALPAIAIDLDDFRLDKARSRGIDLCINPGDVDDIREAVGRHCVDDGANVVIEATGKPSVYPTAVRLACTATRRRSE